MYKNLFLILAVFVIGETAFAQTAPTPTPYTRPDAKERFNNYVGNTVGPMAFLSPTVSATFRQIRNSPPEWEKTGKGFAKRFGDSFGRNFVNQTVTYGLDEALRLDSKYYLSKKDDFKSKFSNAVVSAFTAKTKSGKRTIGAPRIIGTYTGAIVANEVWMPKRFSYKDGLRDGSISMLTRVGFNLIREFLLKK